MVVAVPRRWVVDEVGRKGGRGRLIQQDVETTGSCEPTRRLEQEDGAHREEWHKGQ